jgi:hypothetical protein
LDHVCGWVKPGTATALMVCLHHRCSRVDQLISQTGCFWSRKDDSTRRSRDPSNDGRGYRRGSCRRSPP